MNSSIENLFNELGYDWKKMPINKFINVEDKKIKVLSLNHKTQVQEYSLIKKIIRKKDSKLFFVKTNNNIIECSKNHKIAIKFDINKKEFFYIEIGKIRKNQMFYVNENNNWVEAKIEETKQIIPILDFELAGDHNYYSNNILSHNSYGNPEVTTCGVALKFWCSIRMEVRKSEFVEIGTNDSKEQIGIISKVKFVKNKTSNPGKIGFIKILFGKGIQTDEEVIDYALSLNVIERRGTWYFDGDTRIAQGKDNVVLEMQKNRDYFNKIKEKVILRMKKEDIENQVDSENINEERIVEAIIEDIKDTKEVIEQEILENSEELIEKEKFIEEKIIESNIDLTKENNEPIKKQRGRPAKRMIKEIEEDIKEPNEVIDLSHLNI